MKLVRCVWAGAVLVLASGCYVPRRVRVVDAGGEADLGGPDVVDVVDVPAIDVLDAAPLADAADEADVPDAIDVGDVGDVIDVVDVVYAPGCAFHEIVVPMLETNVCGSNLRDEVRCNGMCVRLERDSQNCSECGLSCGGTGVCIASRCMPRLESNSVCPLPVSERTATTNLMTDRNNCGSCGQRCGVLQNCAGGACECMPGYRMCLGATPVNTCVDLQTSNFNCGGCGIECSPSTVCIRGSCMPRPGFPQSCAEARATREGPVRLYLGNNCDQPYEAYCDDLESGPTTWLALPQGDATFERNFSFSRWQDNGNLGTNSAFGPGLITRFQRVRFEPESLRINVHDPRHATSDGWDYPNGLLVDQLFGIAAECRNGPDPQARINVDLTGLPFRLVSEWLPRGADARGSIVARSDQRVEATVHGACGGTYPDGIDYYYQPMHIRVAYRRAP